MEYKLSVLYVLKFVIGIDFKIRFTTQVCMVRKHFKF